jgi:endo-1,4-beta-xylanase
MNSVFLLAILFILSFVNGDTESSTITTSQQITDGGYFTTLWTNGQGSVSMTLDGSNGYSLSFSNVGDFTAGKGWNPGKSQTISFTGSYSNSGGGCFGIYGWTTNPLIEYYICEKVGDTGGPGQGTQVGTVTSDGSSYTIWKHQQVNQPSISGTQTFWQYISIRQTPRTSGSINVQNHFNAWASLGLNLGTFNYQIFLTESWSGSGSASAQISVGSSPPPSNPPSNPPSKPPSNPPSNPAPSSGSCVVYSGGSSLSSPFSDWSFGGSPTYSGGAVILPIGSSWNALYARYSNGFTLSSSSYITLTAQGGSGSGNQNVQVYAVGNSGSAIGSSVVVSLAPNSYNSYQVTASQLGATGTIYGIAVQAYSSSVVHPSVSFTRITITNANCGQSGAADTADALAQKESFNSPDMIGLIAGIVAAVLVVIVVVVVIIVKMRPRREEIV